MTEHRVHNGKESDRRTDWWSVFATFGIPIFLMLIGAFVARDQLLRAQDDIKQLQYSKADRAVISEQFANVQTQLTYIKEQVDDNKKQTDELRNEVQGSKNEILNALRMKH